MESLRSNKVKRSINRMGMSRRFPDGSYTTQMPDEARLIDPMIMQEQSSSKIEVYDNDPNMNSQLDPSARILICLRVGGIVQAVVQQAVLGDSMSNRISESIIGIGGLLIKPPI
ncbi:hypothetical protein M5689_023258 [Euphorbia peplus]|nr:hypothetical protein M5689_023258 [Euphorbia peplus]